MRNPNLKQNWISVGLLFLIIFGIVCWPLTLFLLGCWLLFKIFGIRL